MLDADVNDGVNTREKIKKHDPLLATLLLHAYGDGPWRYTHTMPRNWGGQPRCAVQCTFQAHLHMIRSPVRSARISSERTHLVVEVLCLAVPCLT